MEREERKTKTKMDGHTQRVFERSHHQQHETIRQRLSGMERSCHRRRQGPGVGYASTAQGNKVMIVSFCLLHR